MHTGDPRNHSYLESLTETFRIAKQTPTGQYRGYALEVFADVMVTAFPTGGPTLHVGFIGTDNGLGWFEMDIPASGTTDDATVRFGAVRASSTKYSGNGTITLGQRSTLYGIDNGVNIFAWLNGAALGTLAGQADWSSTQTGDPLTVVSSLVVGVSAVGGGVTLMRLYEFWMKLNGKKIVHWRPELADQGKTSLPDLSEFGNNGAITGIENTDWFIRSSWDKGVAP